MKCPKCGYNSFEFHDSCKKCGNDLAGFKDTYGLKSLVLPLEARLNMAESLSVKPEQGEQVRDTGIEQADMFSFDIPVDGPSHARMDDPFNFDDEPVTAAQTGGEFSFGEAPQQPAQATSEEDAFASLLETTAHKDEPALPAASPFSSGGSEADLSSFSWDDTPVPAAESTAKPADDDFNSLFGDMDDLKKK
jgi:predicted  nucleic acid-binding Zn-ribbon protein